MSAFATLRAPVVVKTGKASAFARGSSAALPASRASPSVLRASSVVLPARRGRALSLTTKARAAGEGKDGKSVTGRKPNPEFAGEDGKLWVCQGCGYIYDGSLGKWKEESRCPACGERRFALKTRGEMQIAIGSIIGVTVLVAALYALVKLA